MLHQPRSALTKAPALPAIKPWFDIAPARELLDQCVSNPPESVIAATREVEAGAVPHSFDPADRRVALLRAVHEAYFEAFQQIDPVLLPQTRFEIGVSEAIDLALEAATNADSTEALRDRLLAQGLTIGEVNARMGAGA